MSYTKSLAASIALALALATSVTQADDVRTYVVDPAHTSLQFSAKAQLGALVSTATAQGAGSLLTSATGSFSGQNVTSDVGNYFQILPGSLITLSNLPGNWLPFSQPANFAFSAALNTKGAVRNAGLVLDGNLKITNGGVVDSTALVGTASAGSHVDYSAFGNAPESIDMAGLSIINTAANGTFAIDGRDLVLTVPIDAKLSQTDSGTGITLTGEMTGQIQARSVNALAAQFSWKSTTVGDFNDPNNWTGGVVPGPGMVATFELPMEIQFSREQMQQWQANVANLSALNITAGRLVLAPTPPGGLGLVEGDWPDSINAETVVIGAPGQLNIGRSVNVNAPNGVVNQGQLKGNGKVSGVVENNNAPGSLAISVTKPGESVGHLTADGMIFQAGTALEVELNDALGVAGTKAGGWDLLTITNLLELHGTQSNPLLLKLVSLDLQNQPGAAENFSATQNYSWLIAQAGQLSGFDSKAFAIDATDFQNDFDGTFSLNQVGNEIFLTYQAVPEPATWILASLGAIGLAIVSRRHIARGNKQSVRQLR